MTSDVQSNPSSSANSSGFRRERGAILVTVFGNLFMAALGFGFAFSTRSQAILLDGSYSLIGFGLALLGLRVSAIVLRPDDAQYPFGYVTYEPLLNFTKGLLIGAVSIFAFVAALISIASGGREIATGPAFIYAIVAATGCFAFAEILRHKLKKIASPLVYTDRKNWLIDGVISLGVAAAFLLAILLPEFGAEDWVPYVDPVVTAIICLALLPIPFRIIRENWAQIVARSAPNDLVFEINSILDDVLPKDHVKDREVRVLEIGRVVLVHLYVLIDEMPVGECDRIREDLWTRLHDRFPYPALDVAFTGDKRWFRLASGDQWPGSVVDSPS